MYCVGNSLGKSMILHRERYKDFGKDRMDQGKKIVAYSCAIASQIAFRDAKPVSVVMGTKSARAPLIIAKACNH
jgi:hypothetical protein